MEILYRKCYDEKKIQKMRICSVCICVNEDGKLCLYNLKGGEKMSREEVLMLFAQNAKRIMKDSLSKLIVYGSYARGDYKNNSDIDVMILTSLSKEKIEQVENDIFDLAFDLEMETGIVVNPVLENEEHYNYWLGALPFYNNVEKEGIVIG